MDAGGVLRFPLFIFIFWYSSSSSSHTTICIAHKPPSIEIKQNTKLLQEDETGFSTQRDANNPGNIPVFNPIPTTPTFQQPPNPDFQQPPYPDFQTPPSPTFTQPPPTPTFTQPPPTPTFSQPPPTPTLPQQPPTTTNPPVSSGGGGGSWCIANPTASQTALQVALDYACGYGGADCSAIQTGGTCHDPDTVKDHASYAFNNYYQKNPLPTSCVFGGTAQLSYTDPSTGNCHYASSSTRTTTTTPPATPTFPMTPPSTITPINPFAPTGPTGYGTQPTDYGSEPIGSPNSADIVSSKLALPILVTSSLILWLVGRISK